jgi:hypothetical protein
MTPPMRFLLNYLNYIIFTFETFAVSDSRALIYYVHVHTYSFLLHEIDQVFLQINNSDLFNILCIGTLPSEAFIKSSSL